MAPPFYPKVLKFRHLSIFFDNLNQILKKILQKKKFKKDPTTSIFSFLIFFSFFLKIKVIVCLNKMLEGKGKKKKKHCHSKPKKSILISFVGKFTLKLENHHVNGIKKKNEKNPMKSLTLNNEKNPMKSLTLNNDEKFVTFS
jgi:hypothetical protein